MIKLDQKTIDEIKNEMDSIPLEYHKPFNSTHEGIAVLLEEYRELENEIFFGEKIAKKEDILNYKNIHKDRIRKEAIQVAAMACRIIQELT